MSTNVLIIGGDTKALAINFALSGVPGINTTVLTHIPRGAWPYTNGPIRQHGDSPALRDALEYFELGPEDGEEFDLHIIRHALLVGGAYHAIGANLRSDRSPITNPTKRMSSAAARLGRNVKRLGVDLNAFWHKSRRWEAPESTLRPAGVFSDLEIQAPSASTRATSNRKPASDSAPVPYGELQFDALEFTKRLYDYANPVHGRARFLYSQSDRVFVSLARAERKFLDYDRIILASPQHEWSHLFGLRPNIVTKNATILVEARRPNVERDLANWRARADFDVFYPIDTKAIHRVSYVAGRWVCEYNREHDPRDISSDLTQIFGASYLGTPGPEVDGYPIEPAPEGEGLTRYMENFKASIIDVANVTLGEAMDSALEIMKS
jgi:hypothetical protein